MPRHDDHFHPEPSTPAGPPPESALRQEHRPAGPEDVPGDAALERRHGGDPAYRGPERRLARR